MLISALCLSGLIAALSAPEQRVATFTGAYWTMHDGLTKAAGDQKARRAVEKTWVAAVEESLTWTFAVVMLADGDADPYLHTQDSDACRGRMTTRLVSQKGRSARVLLRHPRDASGSSLCDVTVLLEKDGQGRWRIARTLSVDRPAVSKALDLLFAAPPTRRGVPPDEAARTVYAAYLPASTVLDAYPAPRDPGVMVTMSHQATRRLMRRLLIDEPHPRDPGYRDSLVCFTPQMNTVVPAASVQVESVEQHGNKATVTITHQLVPEFADAASGVTVRARLVMAREHGTWLLDDVSCSERVDP